MLNVLLVLIAGADLFTRGWDMSPQDLAEAWIRIAYLLNRSIILVSEEMGFTVDGNLVFYCTGASENKMSCTLFIFLCVYYVVF